MNYLAHAVLSFHQPKILLGNLISDHVKGKKKFIYTHQVQEGIALHKKIDSYTDAHKATLEAIKILHPTYRLYSGVFVDIIYDHFLALNFLENTSENLQDFSINVYQTIEENKELDDEFFTNVFPFMKQHNWLYNYQFTWAIERSFKGVLARAKYLEEVNTAQMLFLKHYSLFQNIFNEFWADVKPFAFMQFNNITK